MTTETSPRDRAIAYRVKAISFENSRRFRSDDFMYAEEKREISRKLVVKFGRQLRILRAMAVDASDAAVRRAMGLR